MDKPFTTADVCVVLVSDFEPGEKTWADERRSIGAFLAQGEQRPGEIVVMEFDPENGKRIPFPPDLAALAPLVQIRYAKVDNSSALKDAGVDLTNKPLIAVVEADCTPEPGWLRALVDALNRDRSLEAVSSGIVYGRESSLQRVASLLDRAFLENTRSDGTAIHVSPSGALYRRQLLERYRYPYEINPFVANELRLRAMQHDHVRFGVVSNVAVHHEFDGFRFVVDHRRNKGFQSARIFSMTPAGQRLSTLKLARVAVARQWKNDWSSVMRFGRQRLRWWDWPLLFALIVFVRIPEVAGVMAARDPKAFAESTAFR